jgi:hypothetical protein
MGDADRAAAKAMVTCHPWCDKGTAVRGCGSPSRTGPIRRSEALAYYRLTDGKIVLNDVILHSGLMQVLARSWTHVLT